MAHIIVVGNEKGGSGKSTTAMHVATALVRMGHKVGALDLDLRQRSFARYIENRQKFVAKHGILLPCPTFRDLPEVAPETLKPGENIYDHRLSQAVIGMEEEADFILIDCPGSHTRLSQVAHTLADTLITRADRRRFEPRPRPLDLFRDGLDRAAAPRQGRAQAHRLGRGAQPHRPAADAQQEEDRRRRSGAVEAHRLPRRPGLQRARDLPRALPARPHAARPARHRGGEKSFRPVPGSASRASRACAAA